jgi:Ca-activated chloride channel family protein
MFKLHLQYTELPSDTKTFHAMVRTIPESVIDEDKPAKNILYLLDVSGSCDIKMVKESITRSLPFLRAKDRISVISFSTETSVDIPWTACTMTNKQRMVDDIVGIKTGGWSNISNGIFHAIEQCMEIDAHIIILSDGQPNSGVTDTKSLVSMVKNTLHGTNTRIHAFGYGEHETDLLRALTDACGGTYNYIRSTEELPIAYGSVLGAAMSTVVQGMKIQFTSNTLMFTIDNKTVESIYIGDVYADEKKDTMVTCHVIQEAKDHCIEYHVDGINIITGNPIEHVAWKWISYGDDNMQCEMVTNRIEELRVVKELRRARFATSAEKAMQILSQTSTSLKSLQEDIDLLIGSRDHSYSMKSLLNRIEQEYSKQRDNRSDDLLSEYFTPFRLWTSREVSKQ